MGDPVSEKKMALRCLGRTETGESQVVSIADVGVAGRLGVEVPERATAGVEDRFGVAVPAGITVLPMTNVRP